MFANGSLRDASTGRRASILGRFARSLSGTAALEFALVAPVFFTLTIATVESAWLFTRIAVVEGGVATVARQIYTGQVTEDEISQGELANLVCDQIDLVTDCTDDVTIEVTRIDSFSDIPAANAVCTDRNDEDKNKPGYNFTSGDEIVFVRVCVAVDILTPGLGVGLMLPKNAYDRHEIISSLVFRNEPF